MFPIQFKSISISFAQKRCFEDFSFDVPEGARVALIGHNGSGKSSLLKLIAGELEPSSGTIVKVDDVAYVRYASVYKDFREAKDFEQFLGGLDSEERE